MNELEDRMAKFEETLAATADLVKEFGDALKKDDNVPSTGGDHQKLYGVGGLFTDGTRERDIVNRIEAPLGLDLPAFPTNVENPMFPALTGYSDAQGAEPTEVCEPGPTPGTISINDIIFTLGRKVFSSDTIDINELMMVANRADTRDMRLYGTFAQMSGAGALAVDAGGSKDAVLNNVIANQMQGIGRGFQRWIHEKKWTGDPTNAPTNGYKEFLGLDNIAKTGWIDAVTSNPAPELDAYVLDFGGEDVVSGANSIHQYLSALENALFIRSLRSQLNPVDWTIAMTPMLWQQITTVWPLMVYTQEAAAPVLPTGATVNLDGRTNYLETLSMRQSMTITINGRTYPVVVDDGIPYVAGGTSGQPPTTETSTIYFVPNSILGGGLPVTYYEYKDYRMIGNELQDWNGVVNFWTDNGMYNWTMDQRLWCFNTHAKLENRIIARTPFLFGRLDNVVASPLVILDNPLVPFPPTVP